MGEGHAARKNKSRGVHGAREFKLAMKRVSVSPWGVPNPHRAGYRATCTIPAPTANKRR